MLQLFLRLCACVIVYCEYCIVNVSLTFKSIQIETLLISSLFPNESPLSSIIRQSSLIEEVMILLYDFIIIIPIFAKVLYHLFTNHGHSSTLYFLEIIRNIYYLLYPLMIYDSYQVRVYPLEPLYYVYDVILAFRSHQSSGHFFVRQLADRVLNLECVLGFIKVKVVH